MLRSGRRSVAWSSPHHTTAQHLTAGAPSTAAQPQRQRVGTALPSPG